MRLSVVILLLLAGYFSAFGQLQNYKMEQLDSLQKSDPRPVVIFIHTDWCRYCKAMQHTTLTNEKVIEMLNSQFYFISLDGEGKEDILFRGYNYKFIPTGERAGIHELAVALGSVNDQVNYPTITFLNAEFEINYQQNGFMSARQLMKVLEIMINEGLNN